MDYPAGFAEARRVEFDRLSLQVLSGSLPADLDGHVFVVAPVGNVGTAGFPTPSHDSALNGDGMIYRLDFGASKASVRTRLVRSADFYTDQATHSNPLYAPLGYLNAGIIRLSPLLGARDLGNTAFMGFSLGARVPRLAVTFDGGRPLEIDTRTLDVVTPVGAVAEWRAEALGSAAFPPILSTAHPAVDERTRELFFVNYGRSIGSIVERSLGSKCAALLPHVLDDLTAGLTRRIGLGRRARRLARRASRSLEGLVDRFERTFGVQQDELPEDFLYAVRWDGTGKLERYRVHDERGRPIAVRQTMHQIAVTKNWLVLMDTSMKVTLDQSYNSPLGNLRFLERALRAATTSPQSPYTRLYIIRRSEMSADSVEGERRVTARTVEVPLEAVHFLADYDDSGDEIVLHVAHDCAQDVAEWVRDFDLNHFSSGRSPKALWGVPNVTPLDVHRLARYRIRATTGTVVDTRIVSDPEHMWGLSLYGGAGINTLERQPEKLHGMFHVALGFQPGLVTRFIYELYEDYPFRQTSLEELNQIGRSGGKPASIFYFDLDTYQVVDAFTLEGLSMAGAIQFVPRAGHPPAHPRDGYLVAMVISDGRREVWIFDAGNLAAGPLCRLASPELVFGATLHSFYLPKIMPRSSPYRVSPRDDYGPRIAFRPLIQQLFEDHVYPNFEREKQADWSARSEGE
jgi:carotenoid cleavage dioxygenase-like enzyme